MMKILLLEEKEKYLLELAQQGAKIPPDYKVETLVPKEEETKNAQLQKKMQTMQDQILQLMKDKDKPTTQFTLDSIYPFPFDKSLQMPPFPKGVELPKYDKYLGKSDPQDHLRKFGALSVIYAT